MEIIVLVENTVTVSELYAQHGLSVYLKTGDKQILFDVGADDLFLHNAKALNIDIAEIDTLVLSHGHSDHIGGLKAFLEVNNKAQIIVKPQTFQSKFKNEKPIGFDQSIEIPRERVVFIEDPIFLYQSIYVMPDIEVVFPIDTHKKGFFAVINGTIQPDKFDDELFLVVEGINDLGIISSCSHNGITNMIETAQNYFQKEVKIVIGGFHLKNAVEKEIEHVIEYFNNAEIESVYTGHCTGLETYIKLNNHFEGDLYNLSTGTTFNIANL